MAGDSWQDLEFDVALDSGAVVQVCSLQDSSGYELHEPPGSMSGQKFLMGDGRTIKHLGQKFFNLSDAGVDRN